MTLSIDIGKEQTIGVSEEQLATMLGHAPVMNRIVRIGLKNILSDANAGIGARDSKNEDGTPRFASDADYRAAALNASMKVFEAMLRGEVRVAGATRVPSDPIGAEAMRLARVKINGLARGWEKDDAKAIANIDAWSAKLGMEIGAGQSVADFRKAVIAAAIEANSKREDTRATAAERVAAAAKITAKVDVDSLL